jgi:hypothetical protein
MQPCKNPSSWIHVTWKCHISSRHSDIPGMDDMCHNADAVFKKLPNDCNWSKMLSGQGDGD